MIIQVSVFVDGDQHFDGGGGGGGGGRWYFKNFWVGMCHWDPGTLSLHQS